MLLWKQHPSKLSYHSITFQQLNKSCRCPAYYYNNERPSDEWMTCNVRKRLQKCSKNYKRPFFLNHFKGFWISANWTIYHSLNILILKVIDGTIQLACLVTAKTTVLKPFFNIPKWIKGPICEIIWSSLILTDFSACRGVNIYP